MTLRTKFLRHSISWKKSAEKDLLSIPDANTKDIKEKVEKIVQDDPTLDIIRLQGSFNLPTYRLRVGNYRVIFEDHKDEIIILIVAVKHRKDAY